MKKVILMLVMIISLTGCSNKDTITKRQYEEVKKAVSIGKGITINNIEDDFIKAIFNIYNPSSEEDIQKGIRLMQKYMTEDELNEIKTIARKYDGSKEARVIDIDCKYSKPENNTDGMARLYVSFELESKEMSQNIAIEFVINNENKIFKHYIWFGRVNTK